MEIIRWNPFRPKLSKEDKALKELIQYDPAKMVAVMRSSICTGEKTAGFKDKKTGHFTDIMLIRDDRDAEHFKEIFGIEELEIDY